jgi:hypothetical protein
LWIINPHIAVSIGAEDRCQEDSRQPRRRPRARRLPDDQPRKS